MPVHYLSLATAVLLLSLGRVLAQSPTTPTVALTPPAGDATTIHHVTASNFPAGVPVVTALFDPAGNETATQTATDSAGTVTATLQPPAGGWQLGLYRWVVGLADGRSYSATFTVGDGSPHLLAEPNLPSPLSAFSFVGVGFPADSGIDLELLLTGAQGQRALHVTTDASGAFSLFLWPQQVGLPFYAAGDYVVEVPSMQLVTHFTVREHPASSAVQVESGVWPDGLANASFQDYPPHRYIWAVYADENGRPAGEFLLGPTAANGSVDWALHLAHVAPGQYLLATPYDWGEAGFTVDTPPSPTPTATPGSL